MWSPNSTLEKDYDGCCLLSPECHNQIEDIPHVLQFCVGLSNTRKSLMTFTHNYLSDLPDLLRDLIFNLCIPESPTFCQFLLNCSSIPSVISASQLLGEIFVHEHLFYISRIWVYAIHRERLKQLGTWKQYTLWQTSEEEDDRRFYFYRPSA